MKKIILIISVLIVNLQAFSQVTITKQHIAGAGRKIIEATHDGYYPLPVNEPNQTWDFTDLNADYMDSFRWGVAGWYPGHEYYPEANIGMRSYYNEDVISFLNFNDSNISVLGDFIIDSSGGQADRRSFVTRGLTFPSTYLTAFTDSTTSQSGPFLIGYDPDTAGPLPFIDSIQAFWRTNITSTMTGWGNIKTPIGNFQVLQQTQRYSNTPELKIFSKGTPVNITQNLLRRLGRQVPMPDTSYWVSFWSNDVSAGYSLVSYGYNKGDTSLRDVIWLYNRNSYSSIHALAQQKILVYPNPATDVLTVTGISGDFIIKLIDMNGRLFLEQSDYGVAQINIQKLSSGLYMLQLEDSNRNIIGRKKIVRQ